MIAMLLAGPWAQSVRAQDTLTLVVRGAGEPAARAELAVRLAAAVDGTPGLLASVPAPPADPEEWRQGAARARALLAEAEERYRKFDGEGAIEKLHEARDELPRGCAGADHRMLRAARLLEGLVHFTAGRREEAARAFSALAAIAPGWEPDPTELAPKIVAAFGEARRKLTERKPGILALDGKPRGAAIRLDGSAAGEMPRVVEGLLPGRHCIEVRHPAHRPWAASVTVPEGGTVRLRAVLFPERALELLGAGGVAADAVHAGELARAFGTDYLALVEADEATCRVRLIAAETGRTAGPRRCPGATRQETVACLHAAVVAFHAELDVSPAPVAASVGGQNPTGSGAAAGGPDLPGGAPQDGSPADGAGGDAPRWYRSWWFWTLVGGAALVGAGVGLGLALRTDDDTAGYRVWITRPSR